MATALTATARRRRGRLLCLTRMLRSQALAALITAALLSLTTRRPLEHVASVHRDSVPGRGNVSIDRHEIARMFRTVQVVAPGCRGAHSAVLPRRRVQ